jgi:zeaxanthin glucosyltransferase
MANITFITDFEQGHLFPSFKLSKILIDRGHKIRYLGTPDIGVFVRSHNFEMQEILGDIYPLGIRTKINSSNRNATGFFEQHIPKLLQKSEVDDLLLNRKTNLIIASIFVCFEALILWHKHHIPTVILTPFLRDRDSNPADFVRRRMGGNQSSISELDQLVTKTFPKFVTFQEFVKPFHNMPELIACPQELMLPEQKFLSQNTWYIEPLIRSTNENDGDFELPSAVRGKKLIYISLGSQANLYSKRSRLAYLKLMELIRITGDRDWFYVMSLHKSFVIEELGEIPENVIVSRWIPQINILQQASLMITHGGLGTIKECIFFNVPMLVIPLARDQFRNAEQVNHHQLGINLDLDTTNVEELISTVKCLLEDISITNRLAEMNRIFTTAEDSELGANLIEKWLQSYTNLRSKT